MGYVWQIQSRKPQEFADSSQDFGIDIYTRITSFQDPWIHSPNRHVLYIQPLKILLARFLLKFYRLVIEIFYIGCRLEVIRIYVSSYREHPSVHVMY